MPALHFLVSRRPRAIPSVSWAGSVVSLVSIRSIKSTFPPRPDRFNIGPDLPVLTSSTTASLERKAYTLPRRTGALAIKKGMTAMYDPITGKRTPCTVLQLDRVQVISHKTRQKHGYFAVQVGSGWKHPSNVTKPMLGRFAENGVSPKRHLVEFRVRDETGLLGIGESIHASWFQEGQYVDARANCRGMGFAGGMKRHGFSGQPASHGNSLAHRIMGSSGQSQGGGSRVLPGKRMPGRMGGQQVTMQNLKVLKVEEQSGLVVVNGCVAGPKGCMVQIQDAKKKPWPNLPGNLAVNPTESNGNVSV
ncbi:MAG: 54S ribosomal protein L9, mitochondrial [Trizodia sp. TS-e1964]|nr:MAG: 54S ribosomal protein L9, mitochondrial [Trizodia sp. TS-e1964]